MAELAPPQAAVPKANLSLVTGPKAAGLSQTVMPDLSLTNRGGVLSSVVPGPVLAQAEIKASTTSGRYL